MQWAAMGSTCISIMSSRGARAVPTRRIIFNCCAVLATGRKVTVSILLRFGLLLRFVSYLPRWLTASTGHILTASTVPLCRRWRKSPPPTSGSGSDSVGVRLRRAPAMGRGPPVACGRAGVWTRPLRPEGRARCGRSGPQPAWLGKHRPSVSAGVHHRRWRLSLTWSLGCHRPTESVNLNEAPSRGSY